MDDQQALEKRQKAIDARTNLEVMMKETSLITNGISPFTGSRLVMEDSAVMRQKKGLVMKAMMADRANAEALKEAYPSIYQEAVDNRAYQEKIANYNVFQKIAHKVSAEERREARKRVSRIEEQERSLFRKRKELFRERRNYYNTEIERDEIVYRASVEDVTEQYNDALFAPIDRSAGHDPNAEIVESFNNMSDHVIFAEKVLERALRKEEKVQTVTQKMKRHCLLSKDEVRRIRLEPKAMEIVDDAHKMEPLEAMDRFRKQFSCSKLALLTDKEGDTDDQAAQRAADARLNLNILARNTYNTPEDKDEQDRAFADMNSLVQKTYEDCFSISSTNPDLFMGNAHPQSLLYSNSVTEITDYTHGGKHLEQLYTGKRRAKISLDVIREMKNSKHFRNLGQGNDGSPLGRRKQRQEQEEIAYLLNIEAYLKAFLEYVGGLFQNLDEWDSFYMSETDTPDMSKAPKFYGQSLSSLVKKHEDEIGGNGE